MTVEELLKIIEHRIEDAEKRGEVLKSVSQELYWMAQGEATAYWVVKQYLETNEITETKT